MLNQVINAILMRKYRILKFEKMLVEKLKTEACEEILFLLFKVMRLRLFADGEFRKNIENFEAKYLFRDEKSLISVSVTFFKNKMKVTKNFISDPDITVIFKDQKTLLRFLFSPKIDILKPLLNQELLIDGNLNYIYKLGFMGTYIQRRMGALT